MSTKTVWITALNKDRDATRIGELSPLLQRYGLAAQGHFWLDEPDKLAWRTALDALNAARADVWLILAHPDELARPSLRYGLSLFAANLREARGADFPIVLSAREALGEVPALLADAVVADEGSPAWPAKIVAQANRTPRPMPPDYRFEVVGEERLGQWFAIGPRQGCWDGVIFGVHGGEATIDFQAVGPRGALPEKAVLEYAQQGLTLEVGERTFVAWAVRNRLGADDAYYARVKGSPRAVLFMPYADAAEAAATVITLA